MANVLSLNGIDKRNFLTGAEEAQAFIDKDFNKLHMSTIAKTDAFRELLDTQFSGKIKTKVHPLVSYVDQIKDSTWFKVVEILVGVVGVSTILWGIKSLLETLLK